MRPSRKRGDGAAWCKAAAACLWLMVLAVAVGAMGAAPTGKVYDVHQVKAQMVRQLANFAIWPADTFISATNPLVVGVVGNDEGAAAMGDNLRGLMVKNHPIEIRPCRAPEDAKDCHLLFFSRAGSGRLRGFLEVAQGRTMLTVGEGDAFLDQGGMINFVTIGERLRFDVNLKAVRGAKLDFGAQVLAVAHAVIQ